jgi:membrane-bound lytic murein transglycosylase D
MRAHLHYYTLAVAAFLIIIIFVASSQEKPGRSAAYPDAAIPQIIKSVDINRAFDFAGEALPMSNFDVQERLDREFLVNTYWHSNTMLNIKNANKYFPIIEPILKEYGVPDDFKYVAVAESSLRNAVSPAGARGFWQLMKATAQEYGLEINSEVDERYHIEKSTVVACKVIKQYYRKFNNWTLAAAAYNVGIGKLGRQLEAQRANTYYELNLNQETSRYIFRLVAIKEILSKPKDYGFYLDEEELYTPMTQYRTLEVDTTVSNWGDFAIQHGTNYRMLKVYNPWLISSSLNNEKGKTYEIRVPKK